MGIEIDVSTRKSECYAGDAIEGTVQLTVTAKDAGSPADALVLRLVGLAKTRVMYKQTLAVPTTSGVAPYTHRDNLSEDIEFLGYDVHLASLGGKAAPGVHTFPFSVILPPGLPPSMSEQGGGGSCAIAYGFRVRLHRPGMLNFDAKGKVQLKVRSRPGPTDRTVPVLAGPETSTVKQCYCLQAGSMSVGFQADRSAVGLNEPIGVSVVARNDSSATVKNLSIELVQETKYWARGYEDCSTRTLTSVVVPGTELAAIEVGGRRGQSAAAIADTARADLQKQLAAGAGTRHEIVVPGNISLSFKSETIEVRHMLVAKLQTAGCVDAPDVWTPLLIQPGTTVPPESAVKVEASSFPPSSAEATSFLSVQPVSVPQSAVRLQYELPRP